MQCLIQFGLTILDNQIEKIDITIKTHPGENNFSTDLIFVSK